MGKRRSKIDIVYDILSAIQNKGGVIKPTHLLYKANLSYNLLNQYLKELSNKGLVVEESDNDKKNPKRVIRLTDKGFEFLKQYNVMKEFQESFGL